MRKNNYPVSKAAVGLLLTILASACTADSAMDSGEPLPEGKYPVEFTSQMYGMDVTRATPAGTWDGGEKIALKIGSDVKQYVADNQDNITADADVPPFYWISIGETKTVSAYYPYALAEASVITVKEDQDIAANYQASDALYAAATPFLFTDATKKLTFKHLPAKVVANLKQGDGVTDAEVQGATVKFVNQPLSASFDNATGIVTAASPGSSSVSPNAITTPVSGFAKSVQALLVPCQMQNKQFIEVTIGNDIFHYTPTTNTDGKLESGKGYTYEITVKRDNIEVVLKESGAWTNGGDKDVQSRGLKMQFAIDLTSYPSDKTYTLPFSNSGTTGQYTLTVDWGDESEATTILPSTSLYDPISHSYNETKEYTITISTDQPDFSKEQIPSFKPGSYAASNDLKKFKFFITPLLNTGETSFSFCFQDCSGLTSIPADLFANNPRATTFEKCFYGCSGLTLIPAGLFDYNPKVTSFKNCFSSCSGLTSIPTGLFDNNPQVTTFESCFSFCSVLPSIPEGLFDYNPQVTSFKYCFQNCKGLTSITTGLFANNPLVTTFESCFSNCSVLPSIPTGLFDNNPKVTSFKYCFYNCSGLTSIPAGLFAYNPLVTTFQSCFSGCTALTTISAGIFGNNQNETTFESCFNYCSVLSSIPTDLFANNPKATTFKRCFFDCDGLTLIPTGLFDSNQDVLTFEYCFGSCDALTSIPADLFANNPLVTTFESCFSECKNLTGEIPAGLFAKNPEVTTFNYCFYNAIKLKMNANIFCDEASEKATRFKDQPVNFSNCFFKVGSDVSIGGAGTAPALWEYAGTFTKTACFRDIGTTTNTIDDGWK